MGNGGERAALATKPLLAGNDLRLQTSLFFLSLETSLLHASLPIQLIWLYCAVCLESAGADDSRDLVVDAIMLAGHCQVSQCHKVAIVQS